MGFGFCCSTTSRSTGCRPLTDRLACVVPLAQRLQVVHVVVVAGLDVVCSDRVKRVERKYGLAKDWFVWGTTGLVSGVGMIVTSITYGALGQLAPAIGIAGFVLALLSAIAIVSGFGVWHYNASRIPPAVVTVTDASGSGPSKRVALATRIDELLVEQAALEPVVDHGAGMTVSRAAGMYFGYSSADEIERESHRRRAAERLKQVRRDLGAAQRELRTLRDV